MSDPYVGEIRIFAGNFAPVDWAFCDGSLLAISDNEVLFTLIGTTYGGDGQVNFALPDLRSRLPVHYGTTPSTGVTYTLGQMGGVEEVTLTGNQLPAHTHAFAASSGAATANAPTNAVPADSGQQMFSTATPNTTMASNALVVSGGSQPHDNMAPYLCLNFIISLYGVYPSS